jgi:hypothetical protein
VAPEEGCAFLALDGGEMKLAGMVTPPADMMAAARRDLSPDAFEKLMQATGGAPPTPSQLVAAVEEERHGTRHGGSPS